MLLQTRFCHLGIWEQISQLKLPRPNQKENLRLTVKDTHDQVEKDQNSFPKLEVWVGCLILIHKVLIFKYVVVLKLVIWLTWKYHLVHFLL